MSSPPPPPLFVIGAPRSGTTLLRFMLNSSPRIYIPPESGFIPRFFRRRPHGPLSSADVERVLRHLFERSGFTSRWQGPPPTTASLMAEMDEPSPAAFLEAVYRRYARQQGAERWGDKTPIHTNHVDLLVALFPQAQIVHIIRDGRDVALSTLDRWGVQLHVDVYFAAQNWVRRVQAARQSGGALGSDQYLEIRYEHLVADPEVHLRSVCEFLCEPFSDAMVRPHELGRRDLPPGAAHAAVRQPPRATSVGRWRNEMSTADLHLFEHVAGGLLDELGYGCATTGELLPGDLVRHRALATKYAVLQGGRRVLQAVGLQPPN